MSNFNLRQLTLKEIELPLKHAFETSFGVTKERRIILVEALDESGAVGYGECTAMEQPLFNHESVDAAWTVILGTICPMLSSAMPKSAVEVADSLSAIRGNRMAIAAVENALWDLEAKLLGVPLWKHLGGTLQTINTGVSIGLQESTEVLIEKVRYEVDAGYQRIKLKIKPGKDVELVRAVRSHFGDILLSVDANSAYSIDDHLSIFQALDEFDLLMIEQPLQAGDLIDHARLQRKIKTSICLDESITCLRDASQALIMDACRIINIKLGRVGGHTEARLIQDLARKRNIPVWCGGMLETGIGRAHNIAMATLEGFTLPGDISASARYWKEDVVEDPVTVSPQGTIAAPTGPGIGYEVVADLISRLTTRSESFQFVRKRVLPHIV
jgi:O-succinylbenzoate synthase